MNQAQQKAPQPAAASAPDLSLNEMLRVMDVAREIRKSRMSAEHALARDEVRTALRQKLLRTAQLSGDKVTEAEIDAAIDTYFSHRHQYSDPPFSFNLFLAHLWVRRRVLLAWAAAGLIAAASIWGLFFSSFAPLSPTVRAQRAAATVQSEASRLLDQIRAAALQPSVVSEAERLVAEIEAAGSQDPTTALAATEQLRQLHQLLLTAFTVRITTDSQGTTLLTRNQAANDQLSGTYVIVEAVDDSGKVIPQAIRNAETGETVTVTQWAERIPAELYDSLRTDKLEDGIVDDVQFAVKQRGKLDWDLRVTAPEGAPMERSVQITQW